MLTCDREAGVERTIQFVGVKKLLTTKLFATSANPSRTG